MSRLEQHYKDNVMGLLSERFKFKSAMEIPRIKKITLNVGLGEAVGDKKVVEKAVGDLALISGQRPVVNLARKSIAGFKIRDGWPIGVKVTLRRKKMYEFLDRLVNIAIPRIRDFRGLNSRSFDGSGNYSMGVKEQIIFPEIDYDKIDDVVVEGIDYSDSPDYVDAYIASAKYDDPVNGYRDLTEDELESLDGEWVHQQVEDWIN